MQTKIIRKIPEKATPFKMKKSVRITENVLKL